MNNLNSLPPQTTDNAIESLFEQYDKTKEPIAVSFRQLVSWLSTTDRATHLIHSYPAKLLMHIPHFFLNNSIISKPGDIVLDPFCGSGTVLLEACLAGRNALGADTNPLARLISRVKTTPIQPKYLSKTANNLKEKILSTTRGNIPDVVNLEYWFYPHVIKQLAIILTSIKTISNKTHRDFFLICLSSCARRVSLADPHLSVPVKLRDETYPEEHRLCEKTRRHLRRLRRINVVKEFFNVVSTNSKRLDTLQVLTKGGNYSKVICSDARQLKYVDNVSNNGDINNTLASGSVDLIITSPPYAGAQKYIRASSLSLGWLELCSSKELKTYENMTIGREHYPKSAYMTQSSSGVGPADTILKDIFNINPLRACIAGNYLVEMREALSEMKRVLKPGGYLILVTANNYVCKSEFETQDFLKLIAEEIGFSATLKMIDDIRSRGLMTKRNKTANVITREWVYVFKKECKYVGP